MEKPIYAALAYDHDLLRKGLALVLQSFINVEVVVNAKNGSELLAQIEKHQPSVCLIDLSISELSGYDTLIAIKKKWPDIKCLMLVPYDNELAILKYIKKGAEGYFIKSMPPELLYNAICALNSGGLYYPTIRQSAIDKISTTNEPLLDIDSHEYKFLLLSTTELTYKEIADKMHLSIHTIDGYREQLFKKLKVKSRVGLAMYALNSGMIPGIAI